MRDRIVRTFGVALAGAIAAGVALALLPGERALVLDIYLLFVGGLALIVLVEATAAAQPRREQAPFPELGDEPPLRPERLPELARVERGVALGTARAFDLHHRLRPALREIAAHRLETRRGIELERDAAKAAQLLGDEAWEVVQPDRAPPEYGFAPGLSRAALRRILDRIEAL